MTQIPMGSGAEFDRIRRIAATLGMAAGPLGDDTAPIPDGVGTLVVSTDASVENVHFQRRWLTLPEIGWRATASALSDLAAAAATPAGVTAAIVLPPRFHEDELVQLVRGIGEAATAAGCQVLGGDLSTGRELMLAMTVFGHAPRPISRVGAQVGDGVYVTGTLGGARAALCEFLSDRVPSAAARLAFAHPRARIRTAQWLVGQGATAMMDLSDGLAGDSLHLAAASQVGLEITLEQLPIHPSVHRIAEQIKEPFAAFAAIGGEDYELLVTMPPDFAAVRECEPAAGVPLTRVGSVVAESGVRFRLGGENLSLSGYRHAV